MSSHNTFYMSKYPFQAKANKMAEIGGFHVLASLCACVEPEINKMSLKNAWSQMACAAHTSLLGKGFVHHSRDNQLYNDLTLSLRSRVRI